MKKLVWLFICTILPYAPLLQAQVVLNQKEIEYPLGKQFFILEDKLGELTFDQVLKKDSQGEFIPSDKDLLAFAFTDNVYWLRLDVENHRGEKNWLFTLDFANVTSVTAFHLENGEWKQSEQGSLQPFANRSISHAKPTWPVHLQKDIPISRFYFRVASDYTLLFPLRIVAQDAFAVEKSFSDWGYGLFYGMLLVMILYNLFLLIGLRDRAYLYYILSILSTMLLFGATSGYNFQVLFPNAPLLNRAMVGFASCVLSGAAAAFAIVFLKSAIVNRWLHYALLGIVGIASLMGLVSLFTQSNIVDKVMYQVLSIEIILLLIVGFVSLRKGNKYAIYYIIAFFCYLAGGLLSMFKDLGLMPMNFVTVHGVEIGAVLEVILLSMALSSRYNSLRKEKEAATKLALKVQKEANEQLEQKVAERTVELQEANEEIGATLETVKAQAEELNQINEELSASLETINEQHVVIRKKNEDITASILYAQRIQQAILPTDASLFESFQEGFVLYKPKDVVSGDFYWAAEKNGKALVAVVDCTGHGVPGALMSMVGNNLLNQIVFDQQVESPDEILSKLHQGIRHALKQKDSQNRDGMDISLISYDKNTRELLFAGAMNAAYLVHQGQMTILPATKTPIGGSKNKETLVFDLQKIHLPENSWLYLCSDGYQDQFGSKEKRKFMVKKLKELFIEISTLTAEQQKEVMDHTFEQWRLEGAEKQVDDVLVIGLKA